MKTITASTYQILCDLCDAVLWDPFIPKAGDQNGDGEPFKTITVAGRRFWIKPLYEVNAPAGRSSIFEWLVLTQDDPWQMRFHRSQNVWFAPAGLRRGLIGQEPTLVRPRVDRHPVRFVGDRHVFERDMLAVKMFLVKDDASSVARAV